MQYTNVEQARFLSRPNRFIAHVELAGEEVVCHVKNTGRCKELLIPGAAVYIQKAANPARKTRYDLIAVQKGARLINMDSSAPNRLFREWVEAGGLGEPVGSIQPEYRFGDSRLDFCIETEGRRILAEVKGVTLERDGIAYFPDAPTQRGVRHLQELIRAREEGDDAMAVFIVQMADVRCFMPNDDTHPAFGSKLREAARQGVRILVLGCDVLSGEITVGRETPFII